MFLLWHPWLTTTNLSYSFPILKLPPPPCAVLLVIWLYWCIYFYASYLYAYITFNFRAVTSFKTALGDSMSKCFERRATKCILYSWPRGHGLSSRLQIAIQQNRHCLPAPWDLPFQKFHAYMSLASQAISQWIKRCYFLQRQGWLGKTSRHARPGGLSIPSMKT